MQVYYFYDDVCTVAWSVDVPKPSVPKNLIRLARLSGLYVLGLCVRIFGSFLVVIVVVSLYVVVVTGVWWMFLSGRGCCFFAGM